MNILITGASSFTGKVLIPILEEAGHEIFYLVRQDKGFSNQFLWNFTDDLPGKIPECQAIIHLAAGVDFQSDLNIVQYNVNTVATAKLAAYACEKDSYFIFASMVGVHGSKPTEFDDTTPINPENNYAMSKYLAEVIVRTFTSNYTILRIGGIYGLDGPAHLGLNSAITNAYHKKAVPTIKGPGTAKRNYICVSDVAQWIIYLLGCYEANGYKLDQHTRETLYLAGPEVMTIENYLQVVADILLSGVDINRINGPASKDMVIKFTPFPFTPTTFRNYLQSLKIKGAIQEI
ncbi:MAG: NAD(P)-dependent oxidoreductase [Smithella sp.]